MGKARKTDEDSFLDLKALDRRVCVSVRSLRNHLKDPEHPLPAYRLGGKILVRWPEFVSWMETYHKLNPETQEEKIARIIKGVTGEKQ